MSGIKDENFLELLDIYITLVGKQDDVISRLSKVIAKQAMQIKHYENIFQASDITLEDECKAAENAIKEYRTYASGEIE
jgi:hypothetical protein